MKKKGTCGPERSLLIGKNDAGTQKKTLCGQKECHCLSNSSCNHREIAVMHEEENTSVCVLTGKYTSSDQPVDYLLITAHHEGVYSLL